MLLIGTNAGKVHLPCRTRGITSLGAAVLPKDACIDPGGEAHRDQNRDDHKPPKVAPTPPTAALRTIGGHNHVKVSQ